MDNLSGFDIQRIAIIRLTSLGDIIHTLPAFYLLRHKYPDAKISWIVEPLGFELLKNFTGIDELIPVNLKIRGFINKIKELKKLLSAYRRSFDLIIDFQGLIKSALLSCLLKGYRIGFNKKNLKEPLAGLFYNKRSEYFNEDSHVIYKNIHLLSLLNISEKKVNYPLKNLPQTEKLKNFMRGNALTANKFVILNVGGGWDTKILEIDQYIKIVKNLKNNQKSVILWGNEREKQIAEEVSKKTGTLISLYFNFSELIQFIKNACLVITSDTLAMHIADMVETPSVGLFGPTSPQRNGSLLKESIAVLKRMPCNFCYKRKCDTIECLKQLNIDKVINSINSIYEKCN